jgi:hypothetical protein
VKNCIKNNLQQQNSPNIQNIAPSVVIKSLPVHRFVSNAETISIRTDQQPQTSLQKICDPVLSVGI